MMMKLASILLAVLCLATVGPCLAEPLSGTAVRSSEDREFTFVVAIGYKNKQPFIAEEQFCSGTVVTNKHVITAASCLIGKTPEAVKVVGGSNVALLADAYGVLSWMTYNGWALTNGRPQEVASIDIAIMTLTAEINQSKIQPALISPKPVRNFYGLVGQVVGWGEAENGSELKVMQTSSVKISTKEECSSKVEFIVVRKALESENIFCSDLGPKLAHRDIGGPILYGTNILIGVNLKMTIGSSHYKNLKLNFHSGIDAYRRFFYEATKDAAFSVA